MRKNQILGFLSQLAVTVGNFFLNLVKVFFVLHLREAFVERQAVMNIGNVVRTKQGRRMQIDVCRGFQRLKQIRFAAFF